VIDSTIILRKASTNDLQIIADLAHEIWHDYYISIITRQQIDYMLNKMYSITGLSSQIVNNKDVFYVIEKQQRAIGFISINYKGNNEYFLHKFYLQKNLSDKGIGTTAFKNLIEQIEPKVIRLTVNRKNYKSINFYFKNGFVIEKVADFDIGNNYWMNDFIMVWKALPG